MELLTELFWCQLPEQADFKTSMIRLRTYLCETFGV